MDSQVNIPLINYKGIQEWKPKIGDIIIRHGFISRTKWFGVINFIRPDGTIDVIKDGMMKLLVQTPPGVMAKKTSNIQPGDIVAALPGSYCILQTMVNKDGTGESSIWYV